MTEAGLRGQYEGFKHNWSTLGLYERFEQVVALVLTSLIAVIIVAAVWYLFREVLGLLLSGFLLIPDNRMFQVVFGQIATVLIALEFNHSIVKVVTRRGTLVQVRTVLLIAVLALARKFIIFDANEQSAATILALAAVVVGLGATYWLLRGRRGRKGARRVRAT